MSAQTLLVEPGQDWALRKRTQHNYQGKDASVDLHIKQSVSVGVDDVVAEALGVIGEHVDAPRVEYLVELGDLLLGFGTGDLRLHHGGLRLARVIARGQPGEGQPRRRGRGGRGALGKGLPGIGRGRQTLRGGNEGPRCPSLSEAGHGELWVVICSLSVLFSGVSFLNRMS